MVTKGLGVVILALVVDVVVLFDDLAPVEDDALLRPGKLSRDIVPEGGEGAPAEESDENLRGPTIVIQPAAVSWLNGVSINNNKSRNELLSELPTSCWNKEHGSLGVCRLLMDCYPHFRLPNVSPEDSWIFGIYNTCPLHHNGKLVFGVCCESQPSTSLDEVRETNQIHLDDNDNKVDKYMVVDGQDGPYFDSEDSAPGLMDRSHVQYVPPRSPSISRRPTIRHPWQGNYPTHPTHPPLITHPPSHTAMPWWTTRPAVAGDEGSIITQRTTTANPWWPQATTRPPWEPPSTTSKPTTTSTISPWWEKPFPTTTTAVPPRPPTAVHTPSGGLQKQDPCSPGFFYSATTEDDGVESKTKPSGFRISGGLRASPHSHPWIAVLFNKRKQFCGGSLIDRTHILTAAHCVAHMSQVDIQNLRVRLGAHNIRAFEQTSQEYKVSRVVRHKDYDSMRLYNDVAMLTLEREVDYNSKVRPVCLDRSSNTYEGETVTVAGWGSMYEGGPQPSTLYRVQLRVWSNEECRQKYRGAAPGGIVPSYLCAGQDGKDSCQGDSGGPLVKSVGGVWTQVGIVSWGIGCGKGHYPGVYSRVSSFLPWINRVRASY